MIGSMLSNQRSRAGLFARGVVVSVCALAVCCGCYPDSMDDEAEHVTPQAPAGGPKGLSPAADVFGAAFRDILQGDLRKAEGGMKLLIEQSELSSHRRAAAMFWLGYCLELGGRARDATAVYGRLERDYPEDKYTALARMRMKWIAGAERRQGP